MKKITKREFIRNCAIATGGCLVTPSIVNAVGNRFTNIEKPSKWSIEAKYFMDTPRGIRCLLCPNECTVEEGDVGDCRTRINKEGILYSIGYGNPCSLHVDPIEKKPLYHFLPGSRSFSLAVAGCNLACLNCQNWQISQVSPNDTRNYDLMPEKVAGTAVQNDCISIAYTYSEPIVFYEYMYDSAVIAKQQEIRNVMVSAGYIEERPLKDLCKVIDAANIDLKSFDDETYMRLNGGTLEPVLNTLKLLKKEGVWLEITNLIIPEWTDDLEMIKKMCNWLVDNGFDDTPLHFSRFHPMYKLKHLPATPVEILDKAYSIAKKAGIKYVYIGNVPGNNAQNTNCSTCNHILVERRGYRIMQNNIKDNSCPKCGTSVSGIWT